MVIYNLGRWKSDNDAHFLILTTFRKMLIYKTHFWFVELDSILTLYLNLCDDHNFGSLYHQKTAQTAWIRYWTQDIA